MWPAVTEYTLRVGGDVTLLVSLEPHPSLLELIDRSFDIVDGKERIRGSVTGWMEPGLAVTSVSPEAGALLLPTDERSSVATIPRTTTARSR